jgi:hypothetical protein
MRIDAVVALVTPHPCGVVVSVVTSGQRTVAVLLTEELLRGRDITRGEHITIIFDSATHCVEDVMSEGQYWANTS